MADDFKNNYYNIRNGGVGFYEQRRGLIAVWGKEAVQFLNGLITNDVAKLEDGAQMLAAFPNAQGRLLAVVRVMRKGEKFLFETEGATHKKVFQNLFRFTFAGDFFVEDQSEWFHFVSIFGNVNFDFAQYNAPNDHRLGSIKYEGIEFDVLSGARGSGVDILIPQTQIQEYFLEDFVNKSKAKLITNELYEVLRIENGIPKYGVDMDETTIVPELGLEGLISYNKGCYIGQEIIARIHFRGHVAKRLTGLVLSDAETLGRGDAGSEPPASAGGFFPGVELLAPDGKNAGRITSVTYSPKLEKTIALAYIRYDHLTEGTELRIADAPAIVRDLPFIRYDEHSSN